MEPTSLPDNPAWAVLPTTGDGITAKKEAVFGETSTYRHVARSVPSGETGHSISSLLAQSSLQPCAVRAPVSSYRGVSSLDLGGRVVFVRRSRPFSSLCLLQAADVLAKVKPATTDLHSKTPEHCVRKTHHKCVEAHAQFLPEVGQ